MRKKQQVTKRQADYARRTLTKIWYEEPTQDNPYLAEQCGCHGYDILELAQKRSFVDVLYLLFQGELPTPPQRNVLEILMIALINPGPRHPATRAAMYAGVGKSSPSHILPIALTVLGGSHLGGEEVERSMRFLRKNSKAPPEEVVELLVRIEEPPEEGDCHVAPGFGSRFGGIDPIPLKIADTLLKQNCLLQTLSWGQEFAKMLKMYGMGWLATGVAAAVFCDLGFMPRAGAGLFQLLCAPGMLAHGLELANKPITAMPFLDDDHYVIEEEARTKKE